ncbi:MAG TPA: hypothetical protein DET40_17740 [Lentisphaeria bacterium]|nr:hypothetical protein [Lentisphaeria bacterium]
MSVAKYAILAPKQPEKLSRAVWTFSFSRTFRFSIFPSMDIILHDFALMSMFLTGISIPNKYFSSYLEGKDEKYL